MTTNPVSTEKLEAAHDILHQTRRRPLDPIFSPRSIAVIGATETPQSVGRTIMENIQKGGFLGALYPVNPKRDTVLGVKAYPSIKDCPGAPDLAVIITPPATVPGIVRGCVSKGVPGAIIISAGFKEIGAPGVELERQIMAEARRGGMRIVGPNCLGVMAPAAKLNATFAADMARPGSVAFISQSGPQCMAGVKPHRRGGAAAEMPRGREQREIVVRRRLDFMALKLTSHQTYSIVAIVVRFC